MPFEIIPISFGVNCFLIKTGSGFFLIDTGVVSKRQALENELARRSCSPGALKLVILTHGDSDPGHGKAFSMEQFSNNRYRTTGSVELS